MNRTLEQVANTLSSGMGSIYWPKIGDKVLIEHTEGLKGYFVYGEVTQIGPPDDYPVIEIYGKSVDLVSEGHSSIIHPVIEFNTVDIIGHKELESAAQDVQAELNLANNLILTILGETETEYADELKLNSIRKLIIDYKETSYSKPCKAEPKPSLPPSEAEIDAAAEIAAEEEDWYNFPKDMFKAGVKWTQQAMPQGTEAGTQSSQAATKATPLSSAPITCPQCRYTEDIRMKPVTYDCMECGYTWEATKATPQVQEELEYAGVRNLMFWTARMASGLLASGKSEEDIIEEIEKKLDGMSTQEKTFKTILL